MILTALQILYRCPKCERTLTRNIQKRMHFSGIKKIIDAAHNERYYTECGICLGTDLHIDSIVLHKAEVRNQHTTLSGMFYCLHCGHEWDNETEILTAILSEALVSENFLGIETCPSCHLTEVRLASYSLPEQPNELKKPIENKPNKPVTEIVAILQCNNKDCGIEWSTRLVVPSCKATGMLNDPLLGGDIDCPKCNSTEFFRKRVTVGRP